MPGDETMQSSSNDESGTENAKQNLESDSFIHKDGTDVILGEVESSTESAVATTEESSLVVELPTSPHPNDNSPADNPNSENKIAESVDESLLESVNTLDDISSLKTVEEDSSILTLNDDKECDIGQIDVPMAANSLKEPEDKGENESAKDGVDEETEDGWIDVIGSGDLMKRVIRKGAGEYTRPERGNLVVVRVVGRIENGEVVEEESEKKIIIGDAEVIQGLDLTIPLMELNEVSEIIIKPRLAYGSIGKEPEIPPNTTINYEIELLSVEDEPDPEKMSFADRKVLGDKKKDQGNFWYSRGEYSCALQCYRRSLDFLDDSSTNFRDVTEEQKELAGMWIKVSNNMAAAQMKIGAFDAALKSAENVLKVQPKNVKAVFRKGKVLASLGNHDEAAKTFKFLLQLEPDNKIVQQELINVSSRLKSEKQSEKDLYRRMLGQDKESSQTVKQAEESSRRFLKWGIITGGLLAALASIAAYRHFHSGANY